MSVKAELHALIDQLDEDRATQLVEVARGLVDDEVRDRILVAMRRFRPTTLERDGLRFPPGGPRPFSGLDEVPSDLWPDDEHDEFISEWRRWRREGS